MFSLEMNSNRLQFVIFASHAKPNNIFQAAKELFHLLRSFVTAVNDSGFKEMF